MRLTFAPVLTTAFLALSACASGVGANGGSGDNHPEVCAEQNALARNGLVDGRQQSIACPDHGIGPRLGQEQLVVAQSQPLTPPGAPIATTATRYNEYNDNGPIYRAGFDALVSTLPQN